MGGTTEVYVNGKLLYKTEDKRQYSRSCTWRETYGLAIVEFTKKDLKEYASICNKLSKIDEQIARIPRGQHVDYTTRLDCRVDQDNFVLAHVNKKNSYIKRGESPRMWTIDASKIN